MVKIDRAGMERVACLFVQVNSNADAGKRKSRSSRRIIRSWARSLARTAQRAPGVTGRNDNLDTRYEFPERQSTRKGARRIVARRIKRA